MTSDRREFQARVIGADEAADMALLDIDSDGLPALPIGDSDALEVGDLVLAIGNPFGIGQTVTSGIVSAIARTDAGRRLRPVLHPDRRRDQPRQLRRRARHPRRPAGRHQHRDLHARRRLDRHRLRDPGEPRQGADPLGRGRRRRASPAPGSAPRCSRSTPRSRPASGSAGRRACWSPGSIPTVPPRARACARATSCSRSTAARCRTRRRSTSASRSAGSATMPSSRSGAPAARTALRLPLETPPYRPAPEPVTLDGRQPLAGATVANLSPGLNKDLNIDLFERGVVVIKVAPRSPAAQLHLLPGDLVTSVAGEPIESVRQLTRVLAEARAPWRLEIERARPAARRGDRRMSDLFAGAEPVPAARRRPPARRPAAPADARASWSARTTCSAPRPRSGGCSRAASSPRSSSGARPAAARPRSPACSPGASASR